MVTFACLPTARRWRTSATKSPTSATATASPSTAGSRKPSPVPNRPTNASLAACWRVQKNDLIICAELSRLGRSLFMIMDILNTCMEKECRVWTIKEGYRLGEDIQSKVLAFAFGLSAEIERQLISDRTKEALARKKAEGKQLGRREGSRNKSYKLDGKADTIYNMLAEGCSREKVAKHCNVCKGTLIRWLQLQQEKGLP